MDDDGFGNTFPGGPFVAQFTAPARRQILRGDESVMNAKLTGVQTVVWTIRYQPAVIPMDNTWRVKDLRSGKLYNIVSVEPDERSAFVSIVCKSGINA
ncbi:head-tail adaptor protein [Agrobacterium rhizogenes]|nr:head-tail adaptor protein [Rhizobium rhizogenes]NTG66976.1 head-tail adaptor protein [Rhizobium rhizogenes]NTG79948.1 head-tail adaptor protein [Rhizobium rhizogenes]NTH95629.1 head-tail adaptor protein [Rhizobium rhizogenes]NTI67840.1 head-tail adaptor protein [Rhizobium rhizogenes]